MRSTNTIVAIMVVCGALLACKKDKGEDGAAKDDSQAAASAKAEPAAAPAAKYTSGDVLKYLPKECTEGRVFVSLAKLVGPSKQSMDDMMKSMLTGTDGDRTKVREAMEAIKAGGIDVTRDVQEVAVCLGYKGEPVFAIGVNADQIKEGNLLDLLGKAMEKGGAKPVKDNEGGIALLKPDASGKGVIGLIAPTVLVIAENGAVVSEAKQGGGVGEFGNAASQIAYADFDADGDKFTIRATPKGGDIELRIEMVPKGKKPEDVKIEIEQARAQGIKEMANSPFAEFIDDAKKVEFSVEGAKVVAKLTVARSRIDALFKKGATMTPDELMRAF